VAAPVVDIHAHIVSPEYVAAAREEGIEHPDGMPGWPRIGDPTDPTDHLHHRKELK